MTVRICLAAALLAPGLLATMPALAADKKPPYVFGPEPSWDEYRKIAETGILDKLVDPESARIGWDAGFYKGEYRPFLERKYYGYIACGTVNAKNRMGGYAGSSGFMVIIDHGQLLYSAIERVPGGMVEAPCLKMAREGLFPPLPAGAAEATNPPSAAVANSMPATITSAASGLTLRAMPEGAYISAVTTGSPAALAGLKPGMVVSSVNAIPLAGMGDAMLKVVDAAGASASLTMVDGKAVKLAGKP